jgi:type I restriction enzyme M protein
MPFENFTNPFRNPADVPAKHRNHPRLYRLFQPDGSYTLRSEGPVTMWAIDVLHREYNVPLEAMEPEIISDFSEGSHQSGSGRRYLGYVDLVIYDDRYKDAKGNLDVAFIAFEAIEPSIDLDSTVGGDQSGVGHFKRLNAYVSASPSIRYAIFTNGIKTRLYRRDFEYPRALQPIGDLPQYESAAEAAQHSPYTVVFNPDKPDGYEIGLAPLTRDKFREVLGDTRSGCHSILRDNEGLQPQEAVDAMVKFLFAKWYDEQATIDLVRETGESRAYVFSVNPSTDPERLLVQVGETFEQAKKWEQENLRRKFGDNLSIRLAFKDTDALMFKPHTTMEIVKRLQPYSLRRSSTDIKGGVFEDFLGKTFRDDLGQYFTPTPVINLMVGILQPTVSDFIGDPACGSARMLTHALEYVRKQEFDKAVAANNGKTDNVNPEEPTAEYTRFRDNQLFGAELARNVMHVARVNTLMNGAQYADLKIMDSLAPLASITGGQTKGLPDNPGFYPGGLTLIVTNPPFGAKVTDQRLLSDFASRDGVSKANGKVAKSLAQEVAFVNRCLEFLAPGGRMGIVLPDGVLANDSMQYVRDWILRWARIKAVISLPQETFSPYGAGVKTSVLFLEKREHALKDGIEPEKWKQYEFQFDRDGKINQKVKEVDNTKEYQVFMALIEDIGYDAAGRLTISEAEASLPPQVAETIGEFQTKLGWG